MPRRWPTVKLWWPRWAAGAAERATGAVDHGALAVHQVAVAAQEAALALAGEKAEVLRLGLLRHREAVAGGDRADLFLGHVGQRETEAAEQIRRQRREHVALVLGGVGAGGEQRPL